jgi:uncharacterized protein YndB with AHSA1/START domain
MSDRIEKQVVLRAPVERVWRAISDSSQFGQWFGLELEGAFVAGKVVKARIAPTKVDAEVAKQQEPYAGVGFELAVERIEPMRHFSFRWHPFAIEAGLDLSKEPMTRVVFELEEVPGGTKLTITESGFDELPLARRAKAFTANDGGWEAQTKLIAKYLAS